MKGSRCGIERQSFAAGLSPDRKSGPDVYTGRKVMEPQFQQVFDAVKKDPQNLFYTERHIDPLYYASPDAVLLIIGQAPGQKAQDSHVVWNDVSGDRLRDWLGVDRDEFYHSGKIAVMPMDFYFPGKGRSGDLPPRKGFAEKWHPELLRLMPHVGLTVLIGAYANRRYLGLKASDKITDTVRNFQRYLPAYFPLVHPSPRNQIWMARHPWYAEEVLPALKQQVRRVLSQGIRSAGGQKGGRP